MDTWLLFGTFQGPISPKCLVIDSPETSFPSVPLVCGKTVSCRLCAGYWKCTLKPKNAAFWIWLRPRYKIPEFFTIALVLTSTLTALPAAGNLLALGCLAPRPVRTYGSQLSQWFLSESRPALYRPVHPSYSAKTQNATYSISQRAKPISHNDRRLSTTTSDSIMTCTGPTYILTCLFDYILEAARTVTICDGALETVLRVMAP